MRGVFLSKVGIKYDKDNTFQLIKLYAADYDIGKTAGQGLMHVKNYKLGQRSKRSSSNMTLYVHGTYNFRKYY